MPEAENGNSRLVVRRRRRRTSRHRRNRVVRNWLRLSVVVLFVAAIATLAMRVLSPSLFQARKGGIPVIRRSDLSLEQAETVNQILEQRQASRPVYPYSVVPGGVENVKELKWAAEHDPVVGAHYAGFDFERAHIVQLTLAQTVFVSYRIGNHIYWTRHRLTLKKGEKLITDGRMTARTRCANRVEETPQQEASPAEPTPEKMEQPVRSGVGTAVAAPPVAFQSALMNRPQAPGLGPVGPLALYDPISTSTFIPLSAPPIPEGLCGPVKKKGSGLSGDRYNDAKKKKPGLNPCGNGGGGTVPEPGTWVLFLSGLAGVYWKFRGGIARA